MSSSTIPDVFNCCICMQYLTNAVLCPHCSKMCCHDCAKTWIENCQSSCPHCRNVLSMTDLVKCRWAGEVIGQWKSVCDLSKDTPEVCSVHGKKRKIYCSSCSSSVCQNCALWSEEHRHHVFLPLDDVYAKAKAGITSYLDSLQGTVRKMEDQLIQIGTQIEQIKDVKVLHLKDMRNMITKTLERLDATQTAKINELSDLCCEIGSRVDSLNQVIRDTEVKMQSYSRGQLVDEAASIEQQIKVLVGSPNPISSTEEVMSNFVSECIPHYETKIFELGNFSACQRSKQAVFSDVLSVDGLGWRLKVYPNGNGEVEGSFLSLFVELTSGLRGCSRFEYKFELLNQDDTRSISRVYTSDFEVGECWGYTRFCRLSRLENGGFIVNGSLTFRLSVRSPSYFYKCNILKSYIDRCENMGSNRFNFGDRKTMLGMGVTTEGDIREISVSDRPSWEMNSQATEGEMNSQATEGEMSYEVYSDYSAGEEPNDNALSEQSDEPTFA